MDLKGKVALVTGAGSGIGKATAFALAAEGAKVAVLSRTQSEVVQTRNEITAAGGNAIDLTADTSDEAQMRHAVDTLLRTYGGLDIVVANAGINGVWAPIDDLKPDEWDKTIAVNLRGTYLTLHLTVPHLKRRGGSIIVVSSINGTRTFTTPVPPPTPQPRPARLPWFSSSPSNSAGTASASMPSAPARSRPISAPTPPSRHREETEVPVIWPQGDIPIAGGRAGKSEDVAETILFPRLDRARHITGTPIWIDGGQGLLR
jgi:NAD(P)-dependent dehydrogenase (short-subunit alcohol dehydrogenase family)